MNKILARLIVFFVLIAQNGNAQNTYENDSLFSESNILKHLKSLSSDTFEGRRTGTDGAIKAKKYIINQFHSLNVVPLIKDYEQPFSFINRRKYYKGINVLGLIKGSKLPEKYIVISAHYDHEGIKYGKIYNGADDNASGVSALFAFAEYFKNNPPNYSVILAAFDAEELQIKGSKYFMDNTIVNLKDIVVNLNMDMISRSVKNELFVVGTKKNMRLKHIISEVENTYKIILKTGHDGYDGLDNWTYSSDHINFYKKDIPFLYFGVEDHKDYHEPTDDYENIQPEFYIDAVKTIISVFEKIDNSKF
ncbi:MAG: M28 family peptidase [Flaviramulus sp.]|nr:M28 family peptidase [Flaviramulus sp.]NNC49930.1 M28 family peptidase [Flaviramulus sp.]